ncbi:MAG TPA: TIGR03435 family protein [Verrucomicrobiae bacterium]|nr:TIGR03435 family protein [Verrucomicrobiae bacterium]HXU49096.1 TIGR03435 family protein [Candidatus Binatia bacterium]
MSSRPSIFIAALACIAILLATLDSRLVQAQSADDWEKEAGGKMSFDVASVKQDKGDVPGQSNIPLFSGNVFPPNGGRLSITNLPAFNFIVFAFKLSGSEGRTLSRELPDWTLEERYDIEAHAPEGTTKDQMRLMMQSLLADRFKLAMHYETHQGSVYDLVLVKPGKMGPHLRLYRSDEVPCSTPDAKDAQSTVEGEFPAICGGIQPLVASSPGMRRFGARNITMTSFANSLSLDRPIVDKTGINGTIDFVQEYYQVNTDHDQIQPDVSPGPTPTEAMKDQLGLRLQPDTAPITRLVVDGIEKPTPN